MLGSGEPDLCRRCRLQHPALRIQAAQQVGRCRQTSKNRAYMPFSDDAGGHPGAAIIECRAEAVLGLVNAEGMMAEEEIGGPIDPDRFP